MPADLTDADLAAAERKPGQRKGIDWDAELARAVECRESPKALATRLGVSKVAVWRARKARDVMLPTGREQ
jgi:hypothetical protein